MFVIKVPEYNITISSDYFYAISNKFTKYIMTRIRDTVRKNPLSRDYTQDQCQFAYAILLKLITYIQIRTNFEY